MRIIAVKDYNELSRATASLIAAQVVSKPDSVLGLATEIGRASCRERVFGLV